MLSGPKLKTLNKEVVSQVLLWNLSCSPLEIEAIVEFIWRSNEIYEEHQRKPAAPNTARGATGRVVNDS